jgi:murein DD-endopeptidase MepM/ murein hydrolase activator NlpD
MSDFRRWMVLLGLLLNLTWVPAAGAQGSGPVYLVEEGDSLWGIAARFGTTLEALAQANGLTANAGISPGQELIIPGFEGVTGRLVTHDVAFGENLSSVAQVYGVDADSLLALNRGVSPERLYAGQPLIVPFEEGKPRALTEARREPIGLDDTLAARAVTGGQNAWSLQARNGAGERLWLLPGDSIALPTPGVPNTALPSPILKASLEPEVGSQGETLVIRLLSTSPLKAEGKLGDWALLFEPAGPQEYVALQGVHAMLESGVYDLEIQWQSDAGPAPLQRFLQPVRMREGKFGSEALTVDPQTVDPEVTAPEDALVQQLVSPRSAERLWSGPFQFPSEFFTDAFPSVFGTRRSYNGEGYFKYHNGLDFYGGTGVPILAPAPGRVVFAGPLEVRGNATYLDHGWGVYTGYLHQSEILVEVGQLVEAGQEIGLVGATGRVTGPHLHWEVWVGGVPVNPLPWVEQGYP